VPNDISIAFLSDIHGNGFAVEAIATDIRNMQPDVVVNLGDQLWGQANPAHALSIQRDLKALEVRGNNDERLIAPDEQLTSSQRELRDWLATHIPLQERTRLAQLPTDLWLADTDVLVTHGTPGNPWDSLQLSLDSTGFHIRPEQDTLAWLEGWGVPQVVAVGHMHHAYHRNIGPVLCVNVGPGAYQNDGNPQARWCLAQRVRGRWTLEHRRIQYNWDAAVKWTAEHGIHPTEGALHGRPPLRPIVKSEPT